jgi:hypothetical protein
MASKQGKYVVVRTYSAGVYCGVLQGRLKGREATLTEVRLIHSWTGAKTTLDLATAGPATANMSATALKVVLPEVIAVIDATVKAEKVLRELPV